MRRHISPISALVGCGLARAEARWTPPIDQMPSACSEMGEASSRVDLSSIASTRLMTCIAELNKAAADLRRVVMCTAGVRGRELRQHCYELEEIIHKLERSKHP